MDLWDWLAGLLEFLLGSSLRVWLVILLLCFVVIWLKVPYFHV